MYPRVKIFVQGTDESLLGWGYIGISFSVNLILPREEGSWRLGWDQVVEFEKKTSFPSSLEPKGTTLLYTVKLWRCTTQQYQVTFLYTLRGTGAPWFLLCLFLCSAFTISIYLAFSFSPMSSDVGQTLVIWLHIIPVGVSWSSSSEFPRWWWDEWCIRMLSVLSVK